MKPTCLDLNCPERKGGECQHQKEYEAMKLHTHNSIPGYTDGLDEGCTICKENKKAKKLIRKTVAPQNLKELNKRLSFLESATGRIKLKSS